MQAGAALDLTLGQYGEVIHGHGAITVEQQRGERNNQKTLLLSTLTPDTLTQWMRAVNRAATWLTQPSVWQRQDVAYTYVGTDRPLRTPRIYTAWQQLQPFARLVEAANAQGDTLSADRPIMSLAVFFDGRWQYAHVNAALVDEELRIDAAA